MNCPVCQNLLNALPAGRITVDACLGGCGGLWFDHHELTKLDLPGELDADLLIAVNVPENAGARSDPTLKRRCPRCQDVVMMRHFFSQRRRVEVDECPNCGGYWLDAGELALVREECRAEGDCQTAVKNYLSSLGGSLDRMRAGPPEESRRAWRIDRLFQFAVPIRFQRQPPRNTPPGASAHGPTERRSPTGF